VTSTITMTELLVQSYREEDTEKVNQFYALLSTYPNLEWVAPDLEVADGRPVPRPVRLEDSRRSSGRHRHQGPRNRPHYNDRHFRRVEDLRPCCLTTFSDLARR